MVFNKYVIFGAIAIAILLVIYGMLALNGITYQKSISGQATAYLTVIAAQEIPTVNSSLLFVTATPTIDPAMGDLKGIEIDCYVQITGTEDAGLNIHKQPGTDSATEFLGSDSEVFKVTAGPVLKNDIVWWKLVTPYDESRQGWAAADYLTRIEE